VVRGMCCLRPGVPGLSENVRVRSIVGRFLEHSRIFYFLAGGTHLTYCASADWMPRNFFRRIEVMFPIEDPRLRARIVDEILPTVLADNVKARRQAPDGTYVRVPPAEGQAAVRSQVLLQNLARGSARESGETDAGRLLSTLPPQAVEGNGNGAGEGTEAKPVRKTKRRRAVLRGAPPPAT